MSAFWPLLGNLVALLFIIAYHYLRITYTYLTEDRTAFQDFHFNLTEFIGGDNILFQHHVTVEVAIVFSKDFADNFNQDREMISDYLTVYFWDMSQRFRTLHQNKISFSVTSLTILKSKEEQPFIENSKRHSKDGHTSLDSILPLFQKWISPNSRELNLPGFDVAMLFLEPNLDDGKVDAGAVAEFEGACHFGEDRFKSAILVRAGKMTAAMLELAKLLGATHNRKCDDHSRVGVSLVRGLKKDSKRFLSYCADAQITNFIESPKSSCLHTEQGSPIIDPDFDSALPPSILEQCRLLSGSRNATAVTTEAGNECALTRCILPRKRGQSATNSLLMTPLANSRCSTGRCFQGRCMLPGFLLTNVATGMCLRRDNDTLNYYLVQSVLLDRCPRLAAPFERFQVLEVSSGTGKMLKVPCQALTVCKEGMLLEEILFDQKLIRTFKCLDMCLSGNVMGLLYGFGLEVCDEGNPKQRWEFQFLDIDDSSGEFLLYNVGTRKCPYSSLNWFGKFHTEENYECDKNNSAMLWKLDPVLPEKSCPGAGDNCKLDKAQLRPQLSFQWNFTNFNLFNLNVSLHNPAGGVAVAPGVIVAWNPKSNLTLVRMPENCFHFDPSHDGDVVNSLKCKVGRLLQKKNETTLVAILNFNATFNNPRIMHYLPDMDIQEVMGFSVTPTMARFA